MRKQKVSKGVILAAGDGDRLGLLTRTCPKVLLPIDEHTPLISYPIKALASSGINEIAIVVGYLGDKIMDVLGNGSQFCVRLNYIFNPDYLGGNATSLYRAKDWTQGEPIVLCMGDHLVEEKLIRCLLDIQSFNETLCVDYAPAYHQQLAEATKVAVNNSGCIEDIGKELVQWDALDTGVFLLTENFFRALHELVPHLGTNLEITDVVRFLIRQGYPFDTCNVSGCSWVDVDTEEDLNLVRMYRR